MYRTYQELSPIEQSAELLRVKLLIQPELVWLTNIKPYESAQDVVNGVLNSDLVVPDISNLSESHYGIVNPIRTRQANSKDHICEQSYPLLHPKALGVLNEVTKKAHQQLMGIVSMEVDDFAFSITSLTRTLPYQRRLFMNNNLAVDVLSSHTFGVAFDIDHSGGYILKDGTWRPINPVSAPNISSDLRDAIHGSLDEAIDDIVIRNNINVVKELEDGWGVYHIAVNQDNDTAIA